MLVSDAVLETDVVLCVVSLVCVWVLMVVAVAVLLVGVTVSELVKLSVMKVVVDVCVCVIAANTSSTTLVQDWVSPPLTFIITSIVLVQWCQAMPKQA
jgi:hypothetical protein